MGSVAQKVCRAKTRQIYLLGSSKSTRRVQRGLRKRENIEKEGIDLSDGEPVDNGKHIIGFNDRHGSD